MLKALTFAMRSTQVNVNRPAIPLSARTHLKVTTGLTPVANVGKSDTPPPNANPAVGTGGKGKGRTRMLVARRTGTSEATNNLGTILHIRHGSGTRRRAIPI